MKWIRLFCLVTTCARVATAGTLTQSVITEIINDVQVLPGGTTNAKAAALQELVKAPDRVRTGPASRSELTAEDHSITRIGANTVFSFENNGRVLNLEKGALLFHSPKGAGGGTIRSGGVSAAVLGTTLIVGATAEGGFKVVLLEGRGRVTLPNGKSTTLQAGQIVFILPGGKLSSVLDINLEALVAGSNLINGFGQPLPSAAQIEAAALKQKKRLVAGRWYDTGLAPEIVARSTQNADGLNTIDRINFQTALVRVSAFTNGVTVFAIDPKLAPGFGKAVQVRGQK